MDQDNTLKIRKKLIEIAIPLEVINAESSRDKKLRLGHPSTFHLWWARRPLPAARAVIFCQTVDDPSSLPEIFPTKELQDKERYRLFDLIKNLVKWENISNKNILNAANLEIQKSWERCCEDNKNHKNFQEIFKSKDLPAFHDPFAGGGTLPLEAQRLGIESNASDLNPVAKIINQGMIEIPSLFANKLPVNPISQEEKLGFLNTFTGSRGIAEDIVFYGKWINNQAKNYAEKEYKNIKITEQLVNKNTDLKPLLGLELKPIAYLWARTVKSPNPAFSDIKVPLLATYFLCNKKGKETYIVPEIENNNYSFLIKNGVPSNKSAIQNGTKIGRGLFSCIMSGDPISKDYLFQEAKSGKIGHKLIAIIVESKQGRVYIPAIKSEELRAFSTTANWKPDVEFFKEALGFRIGNYGMQQWSDVFTNRQLFTLEKFSSLVELAQEKIINDCQKLDFSNNQNIEQKEIKNYANSLSIYLALAVSRLANRMSSLCIWNRGRETIEQLFSMQIIKMTWDYAEVNPFSNSTGNFLGQIDYLSKALSNSCSGAVSGRSFQADAANQTISKNKIISTDPPYYDNIGYADLSDYFYVWLRKSLNFLNLPSLSTINTPKVNELVATHARHGSRVKAEEFFLKGMTQALKNISLQAHPTYPITIFYAFKQSESDKKGGFRSTGWETFLEALLNSNLQIMGTWPLKTEDTTALKAKRNNLASCLVLVCRKKINNNSFTTRKLFKKELKNKLPDLIRYLDSSNIAPADFGQAILGPGMSIFSKYKGIYNQNDSLMSVSEAINEINLTLDEYFSNDDNELDIQTRFAITFYENYGYSERPFGDAESIAKARNVSVEGIVKAGILKAFSGKVNLIRREDLPDEWDPTTDNILCVWEATQYLIKRLEMEGEYSASSLLKLLKTIPGRSNLSSSCRALAYRLYDFCEKSNKAEEAYSYNSLIIAWQELERLIPDEQIETTIQTSLM